jgi:hypothetical protein
MQTCNHLREKEFISHTALHHFSFISSERQVSVQRLIGVLEGDNIGHRSHDGSVKAYHVELTRVDSSSPHHTTPHQLRIQHRKFA